MFSFSSVPWQLSPFQGKGDGETPIPVGVGQERLV
jgi:hypothetical protein